MRALLAGIMVWFGGAAALILSGTVTMAAATSGSAAVPATPECHPRAGLPNVAARLAAGQTVRVAYLGGSITAANGWRPMTTRWLQDRYPNAKVEEINAAISGTGSTLGAFRFHDHVLAHHPDLVFVEFAVNDTGVPTGEVRRAMEGIVRQAWRASPRTDVCFVYTIQERFLPELRAGKMPPSIVAMEAVADHYGIPTIRLFDDVFRLEEAGKLVFHAPLPADGSHKTPDGRIIFSPEGIHPYSDTGHRMYLDVLARSLPACLKPADAPHAFPRAPLEPGNFEHAHFVPLTRDMLSPGWNLAPSENEVVRRYSATMPQIWLAPRPGESLTFHFTGTMAGAFDVTGPDSCQLEVSVDGKPPVLLNRFSSWANAYQRRYVIFAQDLPDGPHTVKVTLSPKDIDKAAILATRHQTMDDPARYAPKRWYVGSLMILGELTQ